MSLSENIQLALRLIPLELLNTLYMVFGAAFFAGIIGLPLGIALWLMNKDGLTPQRFLYRTLAFAVNIGRSIPFAILMIAVIPFTRLVVGTSLGTTASIVPLTLAAAPLVARLVEQSLKGLRLELIDTAVVMGASIGKLVRKVALPEALPSIVSGFVLTIVSLVGYSAMAGLVGGGGLGKVAIQYGYQRFNGFLMIVTLIVLLLLVEGIEWGGRKLVKAIERRRGRR